MQLALCPGYCLKVHTYDRALKEIVWWAFRRSEVEEWLAAVIRTVYKGVVLAFNAKGEASKFCSKIVCANIGN
jgi:hypothetical protein